jgi:hypothetical protein
MGSLNGNGVRVGEVGPVCLVLIALDRSREGGTFVSRYRVVRRHKRTP